MQFIKSDININFIGVRKIAFLISLALFLIGIASLVIHKGPTLGVDFAGGTIIQIKFSSPANLDDVKSELSNIGIVSSVQTFGEKNENEYLIRTDKILGINDTLSTKIKNSLEWRPAYHNLDVIIKTAWRWHQARNKGPAL